MSTPTALVWIPNESDQKLGGGWSFGRNFVQAFAGSAIFSPLAPTGAKILLIPGSTMVSPETVNVARASGLKIVLRVDNVPRNSRNRNTGTSRLKALAELADVVIYQSTWARWYLLPFLRHDGPVIHNAVDTEVFTPDGPAFETDGDPVYLYSRFNRDETKSWERAWYSYQMIQREQMDAKLLIVGRFSEEQVNYNFDFFMNEHYEYLGVIDDQDAMARIYRGSDYLYAPYFNDACSNTYIEALCCGLPLFEEDMSGGTPEIMRCFQESGREYFGLDRMRREYEIVFDKLLGG